MEINDNQTKEERIDYALTEMDKVSDANLIILPEIWNVGYFAFEQYREKSEKLEGPTISAIAKKANEINSYVFAGSIVEKDGGELYNTSVMLDENGEIIDTYRKIHLFGYGSAETEILTPGDRIVTVDTKIGTLGLSTCYDLRFPELYREMVDKGAEIFLITSGWPFPRLDNWKSLNKARATENLSYLISCNCAGVSKGTQFLGHSMIVNPWGIPISQSDHQPTIVTADIDLNNVKKIRENFPPLKDRVIGV